MSVDPVAHGEAPNAVHMVSGPGTRWTTVNFGEAIPGVQTPLSWGVWNYGMEVPTRVAFGRLGILRSSEVPVPDTVEDRMSGIFYGRVAGNVNFFRAVGERMPGASADVLEEKIFGRISGTPTWGEAGGLGRTLAIAARFPVVALRAPRTLRRMLAEQHTWWVRRTIDAPPSALADAQQMLRESYERFAAVCVEHAIVSMLCPQFLEALTALAERATGRRELGVNLATGFGGMEETQIITDVWRAARDELALDGFLRLHGFHGPNEGRLDARSWREDPAPVEAMIRGYAARETQDPREREREQTALREATAAQVRAGLPATVRPQLRLNMKLAAMFLLGRELGKTAFLHALDGARCAARACGAVLTGQGRLDDAEDVFFLTLDEVTGAPDERLRGRAAARRDNHERYLQLELPPAWNGEPDPVPIATSPAGSDTPVLRLSGIGVVGGRVTGRARVIHEPSTADFEPGDILVCRTTDPSWTPLFMLAEALVIDTGGAVSHGAIVARELGVCCVINTVTGTRDIPDGATITVDGAAGTVEIGTVGD